MNPTLVPTIANADLLHLSLQAVLHHLCKTGEWDYGEIWIPSATAKILELHPAGYISDQKTPMETIALEQFWACTKGLIFPPNVGLPGRVWLTQQPEWLTDASSPSERGFLRHYIAKALSVKTGFGVPVLVDQDVAAVFVFFMTSIREPAPDTIAWMTTAATELTEIARSEIPQPSVWQDFLE